MTSREIVRRTLDFTGPERVAISFEPSDLLHAGYTAESHATPWKKVSEDRWEKRDEWGNLLARVDDTSKGEIVRGVLEDYADPLTYELPDLARPEYYEAARKLRQERPDAWFYGGLPGFAFNITRKLFRMENYLALLILEPELIHAMHDKVDAMLESMIDRFAEVGMDSVMIPEDWGTQDRTLINPQLWRAEFFPRFQRLCARVHQRGMRMFMHSCGAMGALIPMLIEAGVDVLQFDQPTLHGIDTLASYQEDHSITFWCPVDIQRTLQTKDEEIIRGEARLMIDKLWKGRGGFIAGYYGDNASIGLEPRWQSAASEEFVRHGVKSRYP